MARSALEIAGENLTRANRSIDDKDHNPKYARVTSAAAQTAIAEELQRIANALWMLVEQNAKK